MSLCNYNIVFISTLTGHILGISQVFDLMLNSLKSYQKKVTDPICKVFFFR